MESSIQIFEKKARFHMSWSTAKEKHHIDTMGNYAKHNGGPRKSYLELLIGYRKGMDQRQIWDGINPGEIRAYVDYKIACEQLKAKA